MVITETAPFRFEIITKGKGSRIDVGWLLVLISIGIAALGSVGIAFILTLLGGTLMLKNWLSDEVEHSLHLEMLDHIQVTGSSIDPCHYNFNDVLKIELHQPVTQKKLTLCLHSNDGKKWLAFSKEYALHELIEFCQKQGLEVSRKEKEQATMVHPKAHQQVKND